MMPSNMSMGHPEAPSVGFKDIWRFLNSAWMPMLLGVVLSLVFAGLYLNLTPKVYTATTTVIFDPTASPNFVENSPWLNSGLATATQIDSQVEVIKSQNIGRKVIRKLNLTADREFVDRAKYQQINAERKKAKAGSTVKRGAAPSLQALEHASIYYMKNLKVRRVGLSSALAISFRTKSPQKAAKIANEIARIYIADAMRHKAKLAEEGTKWLQKRLERLRKLAFEARRHAETFKSEGTRLASDSAVRLAELESIAQTYRRIYEIFLLKLTETSQRISYPVPDARIVSLAAPTRTFYFPNEKLILAFASVFGLLAGLAYAFARQSFDRPIKSKEDILRPGLNLLGTIELPESVSLDDPELLMDTAVPELIDIQSGIVIDRNVRKIGFISLGDDEKAQALIVKLASNLAAAGLRTMLIDARFDRPSLSETFAMEDSHGFIEFVGQEDFSSENVLITDLFLDFDFLPIGGHYAAMGALPVAFGGTHTIPKMQQLASYYDVTLFSMVAKEKNLGFQSVAPLVDAVVIIAGSEITSLSVLNEQVERLEEEGLKVVGVILDISDSGKKEKLIRAFPLAIWNSVSY